MRFCLVIPIEYVISALKEMRAQLFITFFKNVSLSAFFAMPATHLACATDRT